MIKAFAATKPGGELTAIEYDPGEMGADEVEIHVQYCGVCHSDLGMINNEWQISTYPLVPGHEVVGEIIATGQNVRHLEIGQQVGVGWLSESCMVCNECLSGHHNLCPGAEAILVGRNGGFADKVRVHKVWATPLPEGIDLASAGPLFCGGITVFSPLNRYKIPPTSRVAVIGIGGLGHMALLFLKAWGCEVTAFSTSLDKEQDAKQLGAHHFVNARDSNAVGRFQNHFDLIINTISADIDWDLYLSLLKPQGKLHVVGTASEVRASVLSLMPADRSIGASPTGSPAVIRSMLEFSVRHDIKPVIEMYPMSQVNEALKRLDSDNPPRYRIVLENDF